MEKNKIFIVIAAYNESKKIKKVISDLQKHNYKNIIVVDDGSSDNTYDLAKKRKVFTLKHIINRGQGAALQTGIKFALKKGADIIVTFDADGQHKASDIKLLVTPIIKKEVEISLGTRFKNKKSNTPLIRKIFLKAGAFLLSKTNKIKLTDSHNGLRAISKYAAEKINIKSDGMEHASEIISEITKHKLKYKEIPVTIEYTKYSKQHGQSTLNAFRILFKMIIRGIIS